MKKINIKFLYIIIILLTIMFALYMYILSGNGFELPLFSGCGDRDPGHDFFQSLIMVKDHTQYDIYPFPYPPISVLYYQILCNLTHITSPEILGMGFDDAYYAYYGNSFARALNFYLSLFVVMSIGMMMVDYCIKNKKENNTILDYICYIFVFISSGFISVMLSGNAIRYAIVLTMFFVLYNNNKNRLVKNVSLFAFALAINIKPYVAIFGMYLLYDKRYKDIIKLFIYSGLLFVVPLFFLDGGFYNIIKFFKRLIKFYGMNELWFIGIKPFIRNCNLFTQKFLNIHFNFALIILPLFIIFAIFLIFSGFTCRKNWKRCILIMILLFLIPENFGYILGFFSIPVFLFFTEEEYLSPDNIIYFVAIVFIMAPYYIPNILPELQGFRTSIIRTQVSNVLLIALGLKIIFEEKPKISNIIKYLREAR